VGVVVFSEHAAKTIAATHKNPALRYSAFMGRDIGGRDIGGSPSRGVGIHAKQGNVPPGRGHSASSWVDPGVDENEPFYDRAHA